ncbi:PH domain-containing protein [Microlunatus flavus]|uniref:PH domain-containing protein n=1 Tax=Microlunatus flavus TaxID=1036181 RepID=A0A1H9DV96_9ACTN|nr:PH domain-containing protein [Microlunatus flavus]SEQ17419.1 PH domain-containing protein [Microlunatus flavus]
MPAAPGSASTPAPQGTQPVVFTPRRLRVVAVAIAAALVALTFYGWFALPREIRVLFTPSQLLTLLGVLGVLVLVIVGVAASSVRADADGLRVRNGLRVHWVPWDRVHRVMLRPGDPWAFALLRPEGEVGADFVPDLDTQKRHLVGIQAHDGAYAQQAVAELRRRHAVARGKGTGGSAVGGATGSRGT